YKNSTSIAEQLDVPWERGRHDRHCHRHGVVDHNRYSFEDTRHQQEIAAGVPGRQICVGAMEEDPVVETGVAHGGTDLLFERPVSEHVDAEVSAPLTQFCSNLDHQQWILLVAQPTAV